jgi:glycosyltransferase involved in cell wall biosynthesis
LSLDGKRVAMVTFSSYPADPRPRRAMAALLNEGMSVDLVCLGNEKAPMHEKFNGLDILRLPIKRRRGGKLSYAYQYSTFILISASVLALRSLKRRYDLVYVHNMPDILVLSAVVPRALGAKVILDLHDPMPELMTTIFNLEKESLSVRLMQRLEKWSMARADFVLTVNVACKRIFTSRSCGPEKIAVVMNSPDEQIFPFRTPQLRPSANGAPTKRLVIMYHGTLVERNGLDLAVDALAQLREAVPVAELRICGTTTAFLERVMGEARNKGLEHCVHYLGPKSLEDLVREIEDCDVGIIPNHRSAFAEINTPTRIFEYLALGKPVIAPRVPGICDYFDDRSLVFFELGNAVDLARKTEYVYSHPTEVIEIVRRGQKVYREHSWNAERGRLTGLVAGLLFGGANVTEIPLMTVDKVKATPLARRSKSQSNSKSMRDIPGNADTATASVRETHVDQSGSQLSYVLITPARNEEEFIEKTIESVIQQTVLPMRWVIVDDGSTDRTPPIVSRYLPGHPWMELVRRPQRQDRHFAGKVYAFNDGLAKVKGLRYEVLGNLDADISFDKDHFEFLLRKFSEDPALGVAGTVFTEEGYSSAKDSFEGRRHVSGQCQLFRKQCWEEIGGYIPHRAGGIDWMAVTTARMIGWKTESFREKSFLHYRHLGTAERSVISSLFSYGEKDYYLGGHPVWELFRVAYRAAKRPYVVGGLALGVGYCWAFLRRTPRPVSRELMAFHRKEQMVKLRAIFRSLVRFKRVDNFNVERA